MRQSADDPPKTCFDAGHAHRFRTEFFSHTTRSRPKARRNARRTRAPMLRPLLLPLASAQTGGLTSFLIFGFEDNSRSLSSWRDDRTDSECRRHIDRWAIRPLEAGAIGAVPRGFSQGRPCRVAGALSASLDLAELQWLAAPG